MRFDMNAGIEVLQKEIRRLDTEIKALNSRRDDLVRDRDALLELRKGQKELEFQPAQASAVAPRLATISVLIQEILSNHGEPMNVDQLRDELLERARDTGPNTIHGVLNREIKNGRTFTKPERGLYGLQEWQNRIQPEQAGGSEHTEVSGGSQSDFSME